MKVYFISGLAADSRVFKYIQLPPNCESVFLEWIPPHKNESLKSYSERMAEKIDTHEPFAVIGLSMGGMLATEIAKKLKPASTILISSVPSAKHFPFYFRIASASGFYKLVPLSLLKSAVVLKSLFAVSRSKHKIELQQMLKESNNDLIRWSIYAILHWQNKELPSSYVHIHGSKDRMLPMRLTNPTHIIYHAGHTMVLTRPGEINRILSQVLSG